MKKLIFITLLFPFILNAQSITKTKEILSIGSGSIIINEIKSYEDGKLTSDNILWMGRDARFMHLIQTITVFHGSNEDFLHLLNNLIKFMEDHEPGTSTTIGNTTISKSKLYGYEFLSIHPKDEIGYSSTTLKLLKKALKKYNKFIDKA